MQSLVAGTGMPARWAAAVRWYRRASRERARRAAEGAAIAALLEDLRDTQRPDVLRQRYAAAGAGWARGVAADPMSAELPPATLRHVEDAAFGLRWLEIAGDFRINVARSLIKQLGHGIASVQVGS